MPELGAVISYGGHVVIAEEITRGPDGQIIAVRFSEMNSRRHADGSEAPDYDANGNFIPADPDEFSCDRVLTRNPDGTWSINGEDVGNVTVFNPDYP